MRQKMPYAGFDMRNTKKLKLCAISEKITAVDPSTVGCHCSSRDSWKQSDDVKAETNHQ